MYIRVFAKKPPHFWRSTGPASRRIRSKRQWYGLIEDEINIVEEKWVIKRPASCFQASSTSARPGSAIQWVNLSPYHIGVTDFEKNA